MVNEIDTSPARRREVTMLVNQLAGLAIQEAQWDLDWANAPETPSVRIPQIQPYAAQQTAVLDAVEALRQAVHKLDFEQMVANGGLHWVIPQIIARRRAIE